MFYVKIITILTKKICVKVNIFQITYSVLVRKLEDHVLHWRGYGYTYGLNPLLKRDPSPAAGH